jgi:hypothetical protein
MRISRLSALALLAGLAGCPLCEPLEPLELPGDGCQPLLAGADCLLPYPSDFFRVPDDAMASGFRVEHGPAAKMLTAEGYSADVNEIRGSDGFSIAPPVVALLGGPVTAEGLVGIFDDKSAAAAPTSKTLLLDVEAGELVPHFVDLDPRAEDPSRQAIVLRPEVILKERTRYVVALRHLASPDGGEAPPPEGFRRLRDHVGSSDPSLADLQTRFDEQVFAPLEALGVDRAELQLAWDFTTGAEEWAVADMLRARELALEQLAENPPEVEITGSLEEDADGVWRTVFGRITAPLVLEQDLPGKGVARDELGRVKINGQTTFTFTALVPDSVRDAHEPGLLMHFGHGFFGSQQEADGSAIHLMADRTGSVVFAIDWVGMAVGDIGEVVSSVGGDVSHGMAFGDRLPQAMVNWLTLSAALDGPMQQLPEFQRPTSPDAPGVVEDPDNPGETNAGELVYDPSDTAFVGISMGHILGGVYSALNPKITRTVLHVGGAAFSQIMFRAVPFDRFLALMNFSVPDRLDQQKLSATMARHFDRFDPATYARFVTRDELPSGPPGGHEARRVLVQAGMGDTQVPNFTSYLHARMLGIPLVTPSPETPWGLSTASAPHEGSGLTVFDLGVDTSFYAVAEPADSATITHDELRLHDEPLAQIRAFLHEGRIVDPCDGPCVLEPFE